MTNADQSPEHYSLEPEEQFKVLGQARMEQIDRIAVYHGHPETPAKPSQEDIRPAYDPQISHLIVSLAEKSPEIKAFRIKNGLAIPEVLELV